MTQILTRPACPRRGPGRLATCAAALFLASCAAPPVVAPPPPATVEAAATEPSGTARPSGPSSAYLWTDRINSSAQRLRGNLSGRDVNVAQTTDLRLWVSLPADQAFAPGRSALKAPATGWLDQVAIALRELPRAEVQIVSDADTATNSNSARVLALDRAASARDWLVIRGVPAQRIGVAARGATTLAAGDQRRLDILIGDRSRASP